MLQGKIVYCWIFFSFVDFAICETFQVIVSPNLAKEDYAKGDVKILNDNWSICINVILQSKRKVVVSEEHMPLFADGFRFAIPKTQLITLNESEEALRNLTWIPVVMETNSFRKNGSSIGITFNFGQKGVLTLQLYDEYLIDETQFPILINDKEKKVFFLQQDLTNLKQRLTNIDLLQNSTHTSEFIVTTGIANLQHLIVPKGNLYEDQMSQVQLSSFHATFNIVMLTYNDGIEATRKLTIQKVWIKTPKIVHLNNENLWKGTINRIGNAKFWKVIITYTASNSPLSASVLEMLKKFADYLCLRSENDNDVVSKVQNEEMKIWRRLKIISMDWETESPSTLSKQKIGILCTLGDTFQLRRNGAHHLAFRCGMELNVILTKENNEAAIFANSGKPKIEPHWELFSIKGNAEFIGNIYLKKKIEHPAMENVFDFELVTFECREYVANGPTVFIKHKSQIDSGETDIAFGMFNYNEVIGLGILRIEKFRSPKKLVAVNEENVAKLSTWTNWQLSTRAPDNYKPPHKKSGFWPKDKVSNPDPDTCHIWSQLYAPGIPFYDEITHQAVLDFSFGREGTLHCVVGNDDIDIPVYDNFRTKVITMTRDSVENFAKFFAKVTDTSPLILKLESVTLGESEHPEKCVDSATANNESLPIYMIQPSAPINQLYTNAFNFPIYQFQYTLSKE